MTLSFKDLCSLWAMGMFIAAFLVGLDVVEYLHEMKGVI